ncbi:MAG: hypothetical protein H0V20_05475 [Actinobacteria bacterium]|nr:hypothetical protein [Actinomycetota bacterium]
MLLYCGKPERTRFFRLKTVVDPSLLGEVEYEELPEPWTWDPVKSYHLRGESVVRRVETIVEALKSDLEADVQSLRDEIDDLIFDLFEIRSARDEIRRFYRSVGHVERAELAQAARE